MKNFRKTLNKSRNDCRLQVKQLKGNGSSRGRSDRGERMKKKLLKETRSDENLSGNDDDKNETEVVDNPESGDIYGMGDVSHPSKQLMSGIISTT